MSARRLALAFFLPTLLLISLFYLLPSTTSVQASTSPSAAEYKEDINGDGKVLINDIIALLIMGRDNPNDPNIDYNGDGKYTVSDAIALLLAVRDGRLTPLEEEPPSPGETTVIQGVTMAYIPAGSFQMGSESNANYMPVHTVTLDGFQMSQTEITQAKYQEVVGSNPANFTGDDRRPVEMVSWYDAATFCNLLSEAAGLELCYDLSTWECDFTRDGFRLPTEAEWEYACRAGTTTEYYTGDSESDLDRSGWYDGNSGGTTQPVGQKEPNAWNLYDMHGNLWEWCWDWADSYSEESQTNPTGPESGSWPISRGGGFGNSAGYSTSYQRVSRYRTDRVNYLGFRVVCGVAGGSAPTTHSLGGSILENGSGLAGVAVRITGIGVDTTLTTGSDGGYSLYGLADGTYTATPSLGNYTFTPASVEVAICGADAEVQEIEAASSGPGPAEPGIYEPNDIWTEAYGPLVSGHTYEAFLEDTSDVDWYYFDIGGGALLSAARVESGEVPEFILNKAKRGTARRKVKNIASLLTASADRTIELTSLPGDYDMQLFGEGDDPIGVAQEYGTVDEKIEMPDLVDGRYWIAVYTYFDFSITDSYRLKATWQVPGPVHTGTESLQEVIGTAEGATLILEDKVTLEIAPNTFNEDVIVLIEQAAPDLIPLTDDMPIVGTPVALTFTVADGQLLQRDYQATETITISFKLEGFYYADIEDLAVVLVDPDSVLWYVASTFDESASEMSADISVYALGHESFIHQGAQLQGADSSYLEKAWASVVNRGNLDCKDDNLAQLKLTSSSHEKSIPVIFIHGWQPDQPICDLYKETEPFENLRNFLLTKDDITENFSFYTFHYPTYRTPSHNAELLDSKIDLLIPEEKDSLVLICHSMGGLVGRYWMEENEGGSRVVRIITCGTPHRGSPLADMGTSIMVQTDGTRSLVPNNVELTTLEENEESIEKEKYRMYYGKIEGSTDKDKMSWVGSNMLTGCSDGIVPCTRAWLWPKYEFSNKEFIGYNHFEMHTGDSETAMQLDPLFRQIYEDLKELILEEDTTTKPSPSTQDIQMVSIAGDRFKMGRDEPRTNEYPVHPVLVNSFQISAKEITNAQYVIFLNDVLAKGKITAGQEVSGTEGFYDGELFVKLSRSEGEMITIEYLNQTFSVDPAKENLPVNYVTWYGAAAFAEHYGMRLPTEAEWEFAARGGLQYEYATDDGTIGQTKANYGRTYGGEPYPVGNYPKNPFGLYDMSGNVSEWCSDWYKEDYYEDIWNWWDDPDSQEIDPVNNPTGPETGTSRVIRGGNYSSSHTACLTTARTRSFPILQYAQVGFRVAR
ncbi:MAG: SUMF1/EgtB/PvdO family nonheme iron enzyme [Candidatus Glassbacteria bacterium]|nr:SUMF1/EgtB/PvdO family nonheme iron enzyme [Candidatus Glassbacteria bacterium]